LRVIPGYAAGDLLDLASSFFHPTVNLIFVNAHVCLL
jgi:hypothetical protein